MKIKRSLSLALSTTLATALVVTPYMNVLALDADSNQENKSVVNAESAINPESQNNASNVVNGEAADKSANNGAAGSGEAINSNTEIKPIENNGQEQPITTITLDPKERSNEIKPLTDAELEKLRSEAEAKNKNASQDSAKVKEVVIPASTGINNDDATKYAVVWKTPVVVYGVALSIEEIAESRRLLGLSNIDNLLESSSDSNDLYRYLGNRAPDSDMISSVAVQKREAGFGVRVTIITPDKITQVTPSMYENAAISAGVSDCQIMVVSTRPVTGESALAGIYKAFELKGIKLSSNQMSVSRDELAAINAINQSNLGVSGYQPTALDQAVIDTKLAMQTKFAETGTALEANAITKLLDDNLKKYGLDGIVRADQIATLEKFFEKFQGTDAIKSPQVREQLQILGQKLQGVFDQFYNDAVQSGFWDRIVKFVKDVWNAIVDAMSNLVN